MSQIAIKAENISKQYRLGEVGTGTLSHDLNRFWHKVRGKEDPYLRIGEANNRAIKGDSDYVWSLRDINFEIEQGDAVGIIGRNGAGKSTLLKLLSKVTKPTTGSFKVNGRIASLLEVGTGFNPEMTGRENIYLNGAILGMRRHEITRKLDEIIDFSGVERYIDTPVKRYSSGMYVRLAFAVAAHLESEILIVDEVLAVGDAEFQKKCLGKMGDVSKGEGRTVLFVSHNMGSINQLCNKGILLNKGSVELIGEAFTVIEKYIKNQLEQNNTIIPNINNRAYLKGINISSVDSNNILSGKDVVFEIEIFANEELENVNIGFGVDDSFGTRMITPSTKHINKSFNLKKGVNHVKCLLPLFSLKPGHYFMDMYISRGTEVFDFYNNGISFTVDDIDYVNFLQVPGPNQGNILVKQDWSCN
jgi:lipopolysaccharide transport system ATP-binding protein